MDEISAVSISRFGGAEELDVINLRSVVAGDAVTLKCATDSPRQVGEFAGFRSTWVECTGCKVQRIYPYPTPEELVRYYNDRYLSKQCSGSVSHLKVFWVGQSPETIFCTL